MQPGDDGIQSFVDAHGGRWRATAEACVLLRDTVAPWLAADGAAALVPIKQSKRRRVFVAAPPGAPPLLVKRYPPRAGWIGRGRDLLGSRAAAELRMSIRLAARGIATPRALGCVEFGGTGARRPSWFVGVRLLGARALGSYLDARFHPGDGAPAKRSLALRALEELAKVHAAGVWHRDYHGGNLLLHEGEGPAGRLYVIDLHSALELGVIPARLRARDVSDFLHSLRYSFSAEEIESLIDESERYDLARDVVRSALAAREDEHARSRAARAFVESSRFAQERSGRRLVSRDRALSSVALDRLIAQHAAACAAGDDRVVRIGRRSRLTIHELPGADDAAAPRPFASRRAIVKEQLGRGARGRARAAFGNAVAALARDLPVAEPLACLTGGPRDPAYVVSAAVEDAVPMHLLAARSIEAGAASAVADRILDLLVTMVRRRFVHPDLSPKNLLVRVAGGRAAAVTVIDLDAARPGGAWTRRRLLRALAQLGDVPSSAFSRPQRLRFLAALRRRLAVETGAAPFARATARLLARRRRLPRSGAPAHDLGRPATLHLFGNWKWTGPADPALALAEATGPRSRLLVGRSPESSGDAGLEPRAIERGIACESLGSLRKHFNPLRIGPAVAEVLPIARATRPAVIVAHLDADQAIAHAVARSLVPAPAVLRCVHEAGPHGLRTRALLRRAGLLAAPTEGLARALEAELQAPPHDVAVLGSGVDLDRFRASPEARARGRERLGLAGDDVAFGIVARIQTHRRFEILFEAWTRLRGMPRPPRLVVLGRGTREVELARAPVERLGLSDLVVLPGYQEADRYVEALAACDAGIFLVPGTDVSCRAVREWMAMGRPVLASRRAPLPELIEDGVDGWLVDEDASAIARRASEVAASRRFEAAGAAAARKARERFDPRRVEETALVIARMAALTLPGMAASFRGRAALVAAIRPGRVEALLEVARARGITAEATIAFHPRRSRDATLDLLALVAAARPQAVVLEPDPDWDRTVRRELDGLGVETIGMAADRGPATGTRADGAACASD